ncbi:PAAR domain-containing protein [Paraburkholderia phenazinium]|uniref:PAAR motif-containing protein n=1 Tax=Paraburkholderia phenazinium TaxID=60549 RepID=A0A1G7VZT5_9BURK|nr:PAAR domain-containing protein [Paraburkholderia phenazinium]SDG64929.1 hypothetical protein SAMN05216466_104320 [Paraburkholderia phenazinium]
MRKAAVRHGDPTTTRGFFMAYSSAIHDDGKKVALSGDEATCGNCKGVFKIFGTGQGMSEKGRVVVVDGDQVLCPCKKNRVIVGSNPGIFLNTRNEGAGASSAGASYSTVASDSRHWIKFVLRDPARFEGLRCAAHFADGSIEYGVFDYNNTVRFDRISASACSRVEVLLGGESESDDAVTDALLSAIKG